MVLSTRCPSKLFCVLSVFTSLNLMLLKLVVMDAPKISKVVALTRALKCWTKLHEEGLWLLEVDNVAELQ